ncbi:MAG: hypothetical protein QM657_09835 [Lacrimispora sp.]|uniref:hypothetical protein n=1 Tax=Lacrimispora sp. TaxID=2719234 RepID=UPI0039E4C770
MGKIKKEELLTLVKVFEQLNEKFEKKSQFVDVNNLAQCQAQAIDMGNYIEIAYEDMDVSSIIYLLEEYCEHLYQLSQLVTDADNRKIAKKIHKLLINLQNDIRYKLPEDKKEIVFLPYNAAMWDSMESIWLAAKEDERCETYVVPIPYFDKNPDGSLGQMHYEGDRYPDYVPITLWQEYNLPDHNPDIIYIHNPYDNWNYVTSVHPNFYASELKKYTKELIYIPYFVLKEIDLDDQAAINGIEHFITTPGVIYSDKVIVQSEKMKQIYVNEYLKFAIENGLQDEHIDRKYQEKRILGLGTPKVDKVFRTKKDDMEIPKEWSEIIRKSDGNWKKIIFYNTSIATLLEHNEQMLEKIEDVFATFKEMGDEVVLLWRPHPLIPNTIKSMRPDLWNQYRKIVETYKREGWGIYDETADMDRAVVLSDAYYGDASSVLQLYEKTGKKILEQQVFCRKDTRIINIWPSDFAVSGEKIWMMHGKLNGLFVYDTCMKKTTFIGKVPWEQNMNEQLYCGIHVYHEKIYMIPTWGTCITMYDIREGSFKKIESNHKNGEVKGKFIKSYQVGQFLYCIPFYGSYFMKIDMESDKVIGYINWKNSFPEEEKGSLLIVDAVLTDENEIIGIIPRLKSLFIYDISTDSIRYQALGSFKIQFSALTYVEKSLYLFSPDTKSIYRYNLSSKDHELEEYKLGILSSCKLHNLCNKWIMQDGDLQDEKRLFCDVVPPIIFDDSTEMTRNSLDYTYFHGIMRCFEGKWYYFDRVKNTLYEIEEDGKYKQYQFCIEIQILKDIYNEEIGVQRNIKEMELYNLEMFLKDIKSSDNVINYEKFNIGTMIHRQLTGK